ncbi:MAG TPA: methyltransferase domain-containing protein [Methylomirabilota bacterium]|nr:methyltransferase domain-containing protein [Methylomirabilota bacterium]
MDWEELYRKGETPWDRGASPPLRAHLERKPLRGKALIPGCGRGHDVALAVEHGINAIGLDIAPTAVKEARALHPHLAERFVVGSLFDPPAELRGAFDIVLEHTCMSGLHPSLRQDYRRGIDLTLKRGGLLVGVWFIDPDLDPGEEGPPYRLSIAEMDALFGVGYQIVENYIPQSAFPGRERRELLRVLRKL